MARRADPTDLHKHDLIREVATATGLPRRTVERALDGIAATIADTLADGGSVVWTGFGRFELRHRSERNGINPATLEGLTIAPTSLPGFTVAGPYKQLIEYLQHARRPDAVQAAD